MGNASGFFCDIGSSDHLNLCDGHLPLISNETKVELTFSSGFFNVIGSSLQL
jgi:D-ribose pyranose/furanose isomerase RbsD